jgi:hypothetical protein
VWNVVRVVRAASGLINLPQLYSRTGDDLLGGVSELMAICVDRSFKSSAWSSRRSSDLEISFSRVSLVFVVIRDNAGGWGEVFLLA